MTKRRNHHKAIIDPAIEHLTSHGAVCQNYHSPRSMPPTLAGHPDLVVIWQGITWYVEVKPVYEGQHGNPQINKNQCAWFWKFYPAFSYNVRYAIVNTYDELIDKVHPENKHDITVPEYYYKKLQEWKEEI